MIRLTIERTDYYSQKLSKVVVEDEDFDSDIPISELVESFFEPAIYAMGYSSIFTLVVGKKDEDI